LQKFLWIIEPRLHLRSVRAQRFRRHLHRGFYSAHHRIFAHEPDFIHADARVSLQRCAQLLGQCSGRRSRAP
jgi:hypothetical protein